MFSTHTIITPVARATSRSQAVRVPVNSTLASIRAASTISEAIIKYHRELKKYYDEIVNNPDNIDHQTRYGNQFIWEFARHSVAEELLVYPALDKYLGDKGKEHADHDRAEHHKPLLEHHIKEEESRYLPALEKVLSSSDNRGSSESLAKNFRRTKAFLSSHSHPSAGENPCLKGPMDMLAAPIDHIADIFRRFSDGTVSPNPSKK